MMLMLARKADAQRATFAERRIGEPPGMLLSGKHLGVVGLGAIGMRAKLTFCIEHPPWRPTRDAHASA